MACALLYNFKDAARLQKVRFALFKLGVSGRVVAPEELSQPIGYLCDLEGFSPVEETGEGGFSDEMLVLCGLSGPQLDALLSSLRRSRVVVLMFFISYRLQMVNAVVCGLGAGLHGSQTAPPRRARGPGAFPRARRVGLCEG